MLQPLIQVVIEELCYFFNWQLDGHNKPSGENVTIHFNDATQGAPLGSHFILGTTDEAAETKIYLRCPDDVPSMTVYAARYAANDRFLSLEHMNLDAGMFDIMSISYAGEAYVRFFALDAENNTPLCASVRVDRPA